MLVESVQVSDGPGKPPIYDLVFGTRQPKGIWNFADATALSIKDLWEQSEAAEVQQSLFPTQPTIEEVEKDALIVVQGNIESLLSRGKFVLGEHPREVFGEYLGRVRTKVARTAVKQLHKQGNTPTDGISRAGQKLEDMAISPPQH